MTLREWLDCTNRTPEWVASQLDVGARSVRRWLNGTRVPRPEEMRRIYDLTGGAVDANSWVGIQPPKDPVDRTTRFALA